MKTTSSLKTESASGDRDRGGILPIALMVTVTFALVSISLANYASSSLRLTSAVRERTETQTALESAMRIALEGVRSGGSDCFTTTTNLLTLNLNGKPVTVSCVRAPTVAGDQGFPAVVITGSGSDTLRIEENDSRVLGDVYFASPPTQLNQSLWVEDGDVWLGRASCADFVPTPINRLNFYDPTERGYLCDTNNWALRFPAPVLPPAPPVAPPPLNIMYPAGSGSSGVMCRVYYPGRYTAATFNPSTNFWDKHPDAYFVSGTYYFHDLGEWKVKETRILAGKPGGSPVEDEYERLWVPGCQQDSVQAAIADPGTGATFVFGGTTRLTLDDKSVVEIFSPGFDGYSIVGYESDTNGYERTHPSINASNRFLVNHINDGAAFRAHGRIWSPNNRLRIGRQIRKEYLIYGEDQNADGANVLSGIVARHLEIPRRPTPFGYNIEVYTVEPKFNALFIASTGNNSLRVVADVRPSWGELATISWRME